ncbi:hypothetical protein FXB39_01430 [Nocardioides sp. BGMRC 2183]|nr:hypothetical protein FXB39_01430 [Nocardioides sp. BGMRC 2183]
MRWSTRANRARRLAAVMTAVATATVLAGCGGGSSSDGGGAESGLRIAYPLAKSLDPHQAAEPIQMLIATWPVYDRLIQINPDSEYEPMLATEWEFSGDGKTLTLELRDDVTFTDGVAFDAEAVKANLDDFRAAEGTALQANLANVSEVTVVDDDTVEIGLAEPSTEILSTLASGLGGAMISPKALESGDLATTPVGTGAYEVESFTPGQEVVYTRRTDEGGIWDDKTGKPAKVSITNMDPDAQINALKSGQIDLAGWSQVTDPFQTQLDSGQLDYTTIEGALTMVGVNFNRTMKPFDDPLVREAVNYAIDRESIVEAFQPDAQPRVQPWPDGISGFDEGRESEYSYDPEKAKSLLAQAGYADGIDAGEMLVAQSGALPAAAETIQSSLADVGIDLKLRNVDVFTLVTAWAESKANAQLMYMSVPSLDPYTWLQRLFGNPMFTPGGPDQEMTKLMAGLDDPGLSEEERAERAGEAVQYALDESYYGMVYQGSGGLVSAPSVKGLDDLASVSGGVVDLRNTYLEK